MSNKRVMRPRDKSTYETSFPNVWKFFEAAVQANSGGHVREEDLNGFTLGQLAKAEGELKEVADCIDISALGALADAGYNLFGQTRQNEEDGPDDDQHRLAVFDLLDTLY